MIGFCKIFGHHSSYAAHSPANSWPAPSFQQLNYPTRIVHPEPSEGSLLKPRLLCVLCFQSFTTVKFCNSSVLITIQNARVVYSSSSLAFTPNSHHLFSYTYALPNLQPLCFDNVATAGGVYPSLLLRAKGPKWNDRRGAEEERNEKGGARGATAPSGTALGFAEQDWLFVRGAGMSDARHNIAPAVCYGRAEERVAIGRGHFAKRGVDGDGPLIHAFGAGIGNYQAAR